MVYCEVANENNLRKVAQHMRHEDIREIETATGRTPEYALLSSFHSGGEMFVAYSEEGLSRGIPFAAFGCAGGMVWLLCTDEVQQCKLSAFRYAKKFLKLWLERYTVLFNWADTRNTLHLSWIKALGFTFGRQMEINGVMFQEFYMEYSHKEESNV